MAGTLFLLAMAFAVSLSVPARATAGPVVLSFDGFDSGGSSSIGRSDSGRIHCLPACGRGAELALAVGRLDSPLRKLGYESSQLVESGHEMRFALAEENGHIQEHSGTLRFAGRDGGHVGAMSAVRGKVMMCHSERMGESIAAARTLICSQEKPTRFKAGKADYRFRAQVKGAAGLRQNAKGGAAWGYMQDDFWRDYKGH